MSIAPEALAEVRRQQTRTRTRLGVAEPIGKGNPLARARENAAAREQQAQLIDGQLRSQFGRYPEATERLRWARTREILERAAPGVDEDGVYLEMLARQAASIEMVLRSEHSDTPNPVGAALCDSVVLATLPALLPDASSRRFGDSSLVFVSAGLMDWVYQATKVSVLSWQQLTGKEHYVSFRNTSEAVDTMLDTDPRPAALLADVLESYLFSGIARPQVSVMPQASLQAPLAVLTNFNERFIVAHEYGHAMHDANDIVLPGRADGAEEYAADAFAFDLVIRSGFEIDDVAPNVAAQGAWFVLTALDVLREALDMARLGAIGPDTGSAQHPPVQARHARLRERYLETVSDEDGDLWIDAAVAPSRALRQVWERVLKSGRPSGWQGRAVFAGWDGV